MSYFTFALWKPRTNDDSIRFVEVTDLPESGFASVYNFAATDAEAMSNGYKNFRGTVHSDTLKIDCDNEAASKAVEGWLKGRGIAYSKYTTGGRGNHFHVPRSVAPSHTLPAIDKSFVLAHMPLADVSFYHHVGWYRQEGATHARTGLKKTMLYSVTGPVLDMTGLQAADTSLTPARSPGTGAIASVFTDEILKRMTVPISKGARHNAYIDLALRLDTLNQPVEWAFAYMSNVNLMAEEPLSDSDMARILNWAYYERVK
jgi:hypothetical protein